MNNAYAYTSLACATRDAQQKLAKLKKVVISRQKRDAEDGSLTSSKAINKKKSA